MEKTGKILSLFVITILILNYSAAEAFRPSTFQGTVKINGEYPEEDVVLEAYVNGVKNDETMTYPAFGKTWYVMDVTGGANGDTVRFRADGVWANENGTYNTDADYNNLPLTFGADDNEDDATTTTTITTTTLREGVILMPRSTTTTTAVSPSATTAESSAITTTTVSGGDTGDSGADEKTTTTVFQKRTGSKGAFVIPSSHSPSSKDGSMGVIGNLISPVTNNSWTFLFIMIAFLAGYYAQKMKPTLSGYFMRPKETEPARPANTAEEPSAARQESIGEKKKERFVFTPREKRE